MAERTNRTSYDAVVIGGGPAGSTAATLLAQRDHAVLVLDRERFPRFRVGESLMPATYWIFERLGVLDKMKSSAYPQKHSVQFFSGKGTSTVPFYFSEFDPHESSQTWQVDRVTFDRMMLDHARETGAEVVEGANVKDVVFEGARARGVRVELGGETVRIDAKVVVDASGQRCLISRKLGLRETDPKLRHVSYYTRFRGAIRDRGRDEGATLIFWTGSEDAWFWFIPLPGDVVSVGVVGTPDVLRGGGAGAVPESDPQAIFDRQLDRCPTLQRRLLNATQESDMQVIRDFSYVSRRIAGDGWVLAGDAFGFLDPMYSTGVFFALKSAELAADSAHDALIADDPSAERLGRHGDAFMAGMESLRRLVYAYYDKEFHFGRFLKAHPHCKEQLVDLLIGNVFRRPPSDLFDAMATMVELPDARKLEQRETAP